MAATITEGSNSATLTYDSEHARVKQVVSGTSAGTTYYLNDPASGAMEEEFIAGSAITWRDYIMADGKMVAERFCAGAAPCTGTPTLEYFTLDHLGSISVVTNASGSVLERLSYDAWGKRRNADGSAAACGSLSSSTTRGFTGREMMDGLCLIDFNARVYDPSLGRFMSADPVVGSPYDLQELNRYSYVLNNPLSLTDPSGLCFLGCFWKQSWFGPLLDIALFFVGLPELEGFDIFASTFELSSLGTSLLVLNAGIAGGVAGYVSTGTLKGALISAGSAAAFAGLVPGLGSAINGGLGLAADATAGQFLASGLIGGLTSVAGGGNFGSGFLAGGVGSLAGPLTGGGPFDPGKAILSAALGGAASVLGGGKFANGALTGAFSYAASALSSPMSAGSAAPVAETNYMKGVVGPFRFDIGNVYFDGFYGVNINLYYSGSAQNLDWLQTYTATSAYPTENGQYQLDNGNNPTEPFYSSTLTTDSQFNDTPSYSAPRTFQAETSLLSQNADGTYSVIATVKWGYTYNGSSVTYSAPTVDTNPSNFQQQQIKSLNGGG